MMTLEEMVGQQLMIGVKSPSVTPEMIEIFRETRAGGLIIYRPNFGSAAEFKNLIQNLEEALGWRLLVAVDHEGGRVIHLTEGVTVFPDNLALGMTGQEEYARKQGEIEARELRRLGFDLNLAPTLDVLTETHSPNIGIRSYGKDPQLVAKLGSARIGAMQAAGLSACAKHFPGQGHSPLDAHLGLPVLSGTWEEMGEIHLKPFIEAVEAGVDTMMSSHPVYPHLDPKSVPATFSLRIIHNCIRGEIGFKGVILTDDLEMGALKNICSIGESAVRAVKAGHDIVLVCHDSCAQREVFQSLLQAYRSNDLELKGLEKSAERIHALKLKRRDRFAKGECSADPEGQALAEKIAGEAIEKDSLIRAVQMRKRKTKTRKATAVPALSLDRGIHVIFPKISSLKDLIFIETELEDEEKFVMGVFSEFRTILKSVQIVEFDPSEEQITDAGKNAEQSAAVVFFCYDAHMFPQSRKLLERLEKTAKRLFVIFLRDPYDFEFVKMNAPFVHAFGFRAVQIRAAVKHASHEWKELFRNWTDHAAQTYRI